MGPYTRMSSQQPHNDLCSLVAALRVKPRIQSRLQISVQLAQQLSSEPDVLQPLRVLRTIGGHVQRDVCQVVQTQTGPAVEYINFDAGYETPEDQPWSDLEDGSSEGSVN
jgi:hypothetical protein